MKKKVLIIEDEDSVRSVLEQILISAGYLVQSDSSGKEYAKIVDEFKPDLVLLDLTLPEMDGKDICKALKADEKTSMIPIIIVSGALDIYNTILDLCANDIVEKPFTTDVLLARIERQLSS